VGKRTTALELTCRQCLAAPGVRCRGTVRNSHAVRINDGVRKLARDTRRRWLAEAERKAKETACPHCGGTGVARVTPGGTRPCCADGMWCSCPPGESAPRDKERP